MTTADLDRLCAHGQLWGYCHRCSPVATQSGPFAEAVTTDNDRARLNDCCPRAGLVRLADVAPERMSWLWPGYLPAGKLVMIEGDPSTGKSTLCLDLAARLTTGTAWPDGSPNATPPSAVLLLTAEDGLADTVRPRFESAEGDASRAVVLQAIHYHDDHGDDRERPPSLPGDVPLIHDIVTAHDVRLIVVDVLMAFLSSKSDSYRDQDVRGALAPLSRLAETTGCTIILIRHLTKGSGPALYRGGGSIGIVGATRVCYLVGRDPDDRDRRMMATQKNNLGPDAPTLAYRIEGDESTGAARIVWEPSPVDGVSAADLIVITDDAERTETDDATAWLRGYLSDQGGTAKRADLVKAAKAEGYTDKPLRRARERLRLVTERVGFPAVTLWSLPEAASRAPEAQSGPPTRVGTTGDRLSPTNTTDPTPATLADADNNERTQQ